MATLRLVPVTGHPVEVSQDAVLMGRDPGCDIVLTDGSVSRKHARLERRGDAWFAVDQGSANGTYVDGGRITDSPLRHGQELRLGAVLYQVEILGAEAGATLLTEIDQATMRQATPLPAAAAPAPPPSPLPARTGPPPPPRVAARPLLTPEPALLPRPRKSRGPWVWMGGGCCGCLLIIALVLAVLSGSCWKKSSSAFAVVQQMVSDLRQGDHQAAYGRLSRSLQEQMGMERFSELVAAHPGLARNSTVSRRAADVRWNNGAWAAHVVVDLGAESGEQERATFSLVSEDDQMRISAIEIGDAASSPPE